MRSIYFTDVHTMRFLNAELTLYSFRRINRQGPGYGWLDDEGINAYTRAFLQRKYPKYYFASTFLYKRLFFFGEGTFEDMVHNVAEVATSLLG